MSSTSTTARPWFSAHSYYLKDETLAAKRLEDLKSLRSEALHYVRKDVECAPAYKEAFRRIADEACELQAKIADMIASAERLAQLHIDIEEKNGDYCRALDENEEASEEFTFDDAKVLVDEAASDIWNWEY